MAGTLDKLFGLDAPSFTSALTHAPGKRSPTVNLIDRDGRRVVHVEGVSGTEVSLDLIQQIKRHLVPGPYAIPQSHNIRLDFSALTSGVIEAWIDPDAPEEPELVKLR